jgi:hypothetical protein
MPQKRVFWMIAIAVLASSFALSGCAKKEDVIVLTRTLQQGLADNTAVPLGLGMTSPGSGNLYFVVGTAKNVGANEVTDVMISFRCKEGQETRLLTAEIDRIAPGATVDFHTRGYKSIPALTLMEQEPPEITYK